MTNSARDLRARRPRDARRHARPAPHRRGEDSTRLPIDVTGTAFQARVWAALREILRRSPHLRRHCAGLKRMPSRGRKRLRSQPGTTVHSVPPSHPHRRQSWRIRLGSRGQGGPPRARRITATDSDRVSASRWLPFYLILALMGLLFLFMKSASSRLPLRGRVHTHRLRRTRTDHHQPGHPNTDPPAMVEVRVRCVDAVGRFVDAVQFRSAVRHQCTCRNHQWHHSTDDPRAIMIAFREEKPTRQRIVGLLIGSSAW